MYYWDRKFLNNSKLSIGKEEQGLKVLAVDMDRVISINCRRCPEFSKGSCSGEDIQCFCKRCPRNMGICIATRWCRETESEIYFE